MKKNIEDFLNNEVRDFSVYNCQRAIPSAVDGFKPSQRKVIFGMRKKYPKDEIKVSVAAAGCQEVSAYHHGSIEGVMVNMAQSFPGSNNVPYLDGIGQFGSRISPDAAASRYIFTKLNGNFKSVFPESDEKILNYLEDDGQSIEPDYYLPVIPNILLNGAEGMGTGFACEVLPYNPSKLIENCIAVITGRPQAKLIPWFRGFTGEVSKDDAQTIISGKFEIVNTTTLKITELPVGVYTTDYRAHLNKLEDRGLIKNYDDNSTEERTEFIITAPRETLKATTEELYKQFNLVKRVTENLTLWDETGHIRKFKSAEDIVAWFVKFRLVKYEQRRQADLKLLQETIAELDERVRFIKYYIKNANLVSQQTRQELEADLQAQGFKNIETLMSIRVYNLTQDQIAALEQRRDNTELEYQALMATTADKLYLKELKELKL